MKKIIMIMLAALMCCSFITVKAADDRSDDSPPVIIDIPDNPNPPQPENRDYQHRTIAIHEGVEGIKVLGERHLASRYCIYLDYSCSGIEFNADCRKRMAFKLSVTDDCRFKVYVDGNLYKNGNEDYFTVLKGRGSIVIKVTEGVHNIRLVKVSHYRQARAHITSIILYGKILPERPADRPRYLEFIGDSLICGWGIVGNHDGTYLSCDGTLAYSYLAAEMLEADYSMFAISGQGAYYGEPSVQDCYLKASYARSSKVFSFKRRPDAVIINLGTNDYTYHTGEENFRLAFENILTMVREKYGSDIKILIVYNIKNDGYGTVLEAIAGEQSIAILKCDRSANTEARQHPSIAESQVIAENIAAILQDMFNE